VRTRIDLLTCDRCGFEQPGTDEYPAAGWSLAQHNPRDRSGLKTYDVCPPCSDKALPLLRAPAPEPKPAAGSA
jgi:hypothetical protein